MTPKHKPAPATLFAFMRALIARMHADGRTATALNHEAALASFARFRNGADIALRDLTPEIVMSYQSHLRARGCVANTTSFYMRTLRAVFNKAVAAGLADHSRPFAGVYTGIARTAKRAIDLSAVSRLRSLELHGSPRLQLARDLFMLSFYLRGMSFIDMAFLRRTDLHDSTLTYRRRKTGRRMAIAWTPEMQQIVDTLDPAAPSSPYLLPIIPAACADPRRAYRSAAMRINADLKTIGRMAGLSAPLTLYVARHSWASAARAKGIPLAVISQGMGHDSETTTQIYLAALDTAAVDAANSLILNSL